MAQQVAFEGQHRAEREPDAQLGERRIARVGIDQRQSDLRSNGWSVGAEHDLITDHLHHPAAA